ncbi:hypothetical protein NQ176_g1007 [Zarea fungicola]|uniref:Uncharacterized protein n=1 Tax=Zarea fungicola TaxID=93591 RepID=A0ACC1NVX3_9HYPO|nr:hypothetical protein NQ176_g1007 [Lecanicillium fungicola]
MPVSSRPSHSKSRNGCLRCKAKKTKCDEKKPSCSRCQDRGFQCPGYALDIRWSHKHQVRSERAAFDTAASSGPISFEGIEIEAFEAPNVSSCGQQLESLGRSAGLGATPEPAHGVSELQSPHSTTDAAASNFSLLHQTDVFDSNLAPIAWTLDNGEGATLEAGMGGIPPTPASPQPWDDVYHNERRRSSSISADGDVEEIVPIRLEADTFSCTQAGIFNLPTALSEYFFRDIIAAYCLWDSKANEMRNLVEATWQFSGALYHTIQSMAAACLSREFPHMRAVALDEHNQARSHVQHYSSLSSGKDRDSMLLAATLLGHTSSWLDPKNLATDMYRTSYGMLTEAAQSQTASQDLLSFFGGTMDYWTMLLAFLTDGKELELEQHRAQTRVAGHYQGPKKEAEPHPYVGISHDMVRALGKVGSLVFRHRKILSGVKFLTEDDFDVFRAAIQEARRLERVFLAHRTPDLSGVADPGDLKTPLKHLELIDEAYRCTGLLQLYRVFPDLLKERYRPWEADELLQPLPSDRVPTESERNQWLTDFALHILGVLQEIPFESRTRSAQPFLMVAISSELRIPKASSVPTEFNNCPGSSALPGLDTTSINTARARKFVSSRLAAYTHILPVRKSQVILDLTSEVWRAMDSGKRDVYWLDIATEKQLKTMMG